MDNRMIIGDKMFEVNIPKCYEYLFKDRKKQEFVLNKKGEYLLPFWDKTRLVKIFAGKLIN